MSSRTAERPTVAEPRRRSNRQAIAVVSGAGVLLAVALLLFATTLPDGGGAATTLTRRTASQPTASPAPTAATTGGFGYQPLWPFGSVAAAAGWQRGYRADARFQAWHLNPGVTALSFARGYLGYNDLNKVFHFAVAGSQAWVGVGYSGAVTPAGVVHLARIGAGADAPWEVVGTKDTTLSLTSPGYGTRVNSPLTVSGRITGSNESMRVMIRGLGGLLGQTSGVTAGGTGATWSAQVGFTASPGTVLALAVATGGHIRAVERFAVVAVVAGASSRPVADVDGDGVADTVRLVRPASVRVDYGSGRVDVVPFSVAAGYPAALLGEVDADKDGTAEVFVRTGTATTGVLRYVSGRLRLVTLEGVQVALTMAGTGQRRASWACGTAAGAVTTWSGGGSGGGTVAGITRDYRFDGAALDQVGSHAYTVGAGNPAPAGCGNLTV
jgi:hypothetical protein